MKIFAYQVRPTCFPMANSNGIVIWTFLLIMTGAVVRGEIGPNAVALINGQTTLDCVATQLAASQWSRTTDGTNNWLQVATGCSIIGNNSAYYRTEQPGGNICRLIIANATMQQAGVYSCFDGTSTSFRSLVTIIDPNANVTVYKQSEVVVGDQLNISCSINYNGPANPAPSLRPSPYWTTSPGQIFNSAIYHPSTTVVTLVATVTIQKPTVPAFKCFSVFEVTGNTSGYNSTPPSDNLTLLGATTQIDDVQYGPSVPVITSRAEVITLNGVSCGISVLMCTSSGNPPPNYKWFGTAENVSISDQQNLTLAEVNRNYKCEAYNTIRNKLYTTSKKYTVSRNDSVSYLRYCVYPRNEATSITVDGCENGTMCDCSSGSSGVTLICNADTYPNASYIWNGTDGNVIYSQVHNEITMNGTYWCTVYFNRTSSNYTGSVTFTNGTNETTVSSCCGSWQLVISVVIPYIGGNAIVLVAFFVVYFRSESFTPIMKQRFPVHTTGKVVLLVITSIFFGLTSVPILVTIAFVSSRKQVGNATMNGEQNHQMSEGSNPPSITGTDPTGNNLLNAVGSSAGLSIWKIALMWSVAVALLFPTAFLVVYFVPCNQMRYEIA